MGGSGKKARGRASKAKKKNGEAAKPPPPPPAASVPSSSDEESKYNWAEEWLVEEEKALRSVKMFCRGLFCDVNMRYASRYLRRAARQGHADAIERMRERRSCTFCGTDDAPRACGLCRKVR
jgi:hypothetical protein